MCIRTNKREKITLVTHITMNIREEIEVGKIPYQIFQLYCTNAINWAFTIKTDGEPRESNWDVYINLVSPTNFEVYTFHINNNNEVTATIGYKIEYINDSIIVIESASEYNTKFEFLSLFDEETRNANEEHNKKRETSINEIHKLTMELLLMGFANSLKNTTAADIYKLYPPVFNPISCFNLNSNKVEHLRLTPHSSIISIQDRKKYDCYKELSRKQGITPCKEDGYCASKDVNKHDLGAVYSFCREKIVKIASAHSKKTWLPISSLIAKTPIRINTPLYVKPTESSEEGTWLYIATNGIIYGDTIIKAAMEYKVIDTEKGPIELIIYKDENQELLLPLVANELLLIRGSELTTPIVLDIERVVEEDVFASESEEFVNLKANIDKLNDSLIDRNYYDGTKFEELLTYKFLEMKIDEERKRREQEEFDAMVKEKVDKFKQSTKNKLKELKQKTEETVEQLKQPKTDSPEVENPSNEENIGGFRGYYKKHKVGVWIGVVIIIFLVSTCG